MGPKVSVWLLGSKHFAALSARKSVTPHVAAVLDACERDFRLLSLLEQFH